MKDAGPSKTLLLVKTGFPIVMRSMAYRTFSKLGWTIAIADQLINEGLRVADVPIVCDLRDTTSACEQVLKKVGVPNGIMTFNESALVQTSMLAEALELPFLDVRTAECAIDKLVQRKTLYSAGFRMPQWRTITNSDDIVQCVNEWNTVVVKPVDRAASAGVSSVNNHGDAGRAFTEALEESPSATVIAEEYIAGAEVSVESIATGSEHRAICVTDKIVAEGDHFVELGHSLPSKLSGELLEEVLSLAIKACKVMGLNNGLFHTEVKLSAGGPMIVEVNPRLAGDCIVDLVELAFGVNLYEIAGRLATGEDVHVLPEVTRPHQGAAIRFKPNPGGALLNAQAPILRSPPDGLIELSVTATLGSEPPAPVTNAGRIAYAITTGRNGEEASQLAGEALDDISFQYSETQEES